MTLKDLTLSQGTLMLMRRVVNLLIPQGDHTNQIYVIDANEYLEIIDQGGRLHISTMYLVAAESSCRYQTREETQCFDVPERSQSWKENLGNHRHMCHCNGCHRSGYGDLLCV